MPIRSNHLIGGMYGHILIKTNMGRQLLFHSYSYTINNWGIINNMAQKLANDDPTRHRHIRLLQQPIHTAISFPHSRHPCVGL